MKLIVTDTATAAQLLRRGGRLLSLNISLDRKEAFRFCVLDIDSQALAWLREIRLARQASR